MNNNLLSEELFQFLVNAPRIPTPLQTDGYKLGHHYMYIGETLNIMSYDEARIGAEYPYSVVLGLQDILKKHFVGKRIQSEKELEMCKEFCKLYFMGHDYFNYDMWKRVLTHHDGKLPLKIKAVEEGTVLPISNVTMTIEATDTTINPKTGKGYFFPMVNHFETILTHQWGSQNVATIAKHLYEAFTEYFKETVDDDMHWLIPYMLHDFGYRGVMAEEQAAVAGMGHLAVFQGTDTISAIFETIKYYAAKEMPGFSVAASEHSVMTQKTESGEFDVIKHIIENTPEGAILSIVSDSFDISRVILEYLPRLRDLIVSRNIKFVVRPDSPRFEGDTVEDQVVWIARQLEGLFGFIRNKRGYKVLHPNFGIIYGDGIGPKDIINTLEALKLAEFAASTCVFGMGGGLLQKHNRDTQRKAFKCCARQTKDGWFDVYKKPLDLTKASKRGRLALIKENGKFETIQEKDLDNRVNLLQDVFIDGELIRDMTWKQVVENARNPISFQNLVNQF